jgi:hypothetical protein
MQWSWNDVSDEAASTVDPADMRRLPIRIGSAARSGFVGSWLILSTSPLPLVTTRAA